MLFRSEARSGRTRSGSPWLIVAMASLASIMTAPGQTAAISVFTDPLIAELGISRTDLSLSYLVGTLAGAAAMPAVGRALDRYGVRVVMAAIGAVFGAVLIGLSYATDVYGLTAGFVGIRMAGQGALGLAATTAVAVHVTRRRGLALGITAAAGSAGISLAPVLLERLVATHGVDAVWRYEGFAVWAIVIPIALFGLRSTGRRTKPQTANVTGSGDESAVPVAREVWTTRAAMRTPMFWAIAAGLAASGMLSTAVNFHQISLLGEQGLSATAAAANFIPQTVAGLASTLALGALADSIAPKLGVAVSMALLCTALLSIPLVAPGFMAIVYGLILGCASGSMRAIEAAAYAHYFGTANIGGIRGVATMIGVGSTAFGPLALSFGHDVFDNYIPVVLGFAVIPAAVGLAVAFTPAPKLPAQVEQAAQA
ncbi:MAG: MFS transporter [Rhodococcus sp. (in: high G+C Gram-positive bacteria)]|uniref:MFS transporter n=1 Tax=Rhodococcus sp. TaxID=1831 RepID=UPI002AD7BAFA|nr:MFS transporter [Rhodococcus sp. (in: high G+C Gram-positive bacteria)]MDZ7930677.1 MFS transporter [Rhodococcus sp. (in: high G+C Gram-positive bacteria)]